MPIYANAKPCNKLFERIHSGELQDQVIFHHPDVFAVLAIKQAVKGHTLVVSRECFPDMDSVTGTTRRKLGELSRATGIWLKAAFEPAVVAGMTSGREVSHVHEHRFPSSDGRDWLQVMGHPDPRPFPVMSEDEKAEVYARATFPAAYADAVAAVLNGESLVESDALPDYLQQMAYDLRS